VIFGGLSKIRAAFLLMPTGLHLCLSN
jgi:hypothetical protein